MNPRPDRGFTLLEVLVALAITVLGLLSITFATLTAGTSANSLREQSLAHWVAMNHAAELRLAESWPSTGRTNGTVEFAGVEWHWETEISETDVEALRRADITVAFSEDQDRQIASVAAFIKEPAPGVELRPWTGQVRPGPGRPR